MMSEPIIRCPCCGAEFEMRVQAELPLGPIALADTNKVDSQEEISHARGAAPDSSRLDLPFSDSHSERLAESTRVGNRVASCEEDLFESLRKILGEPELRTNGRLWKWRFRNYPKALANAIEDWKLRTPHQRAKIKIRAAWLTDRYKRAESEIINARKSA